MVIDVISFNGEFDLLEIRLNILSDYVDEFIIVEATTTFSGKDKPLYYEKEKARYKKWEDKIKYHIVRPEDEEKYVAMANASPNTRGASHWKKEFCQKECIKDTLVHLKDDDIVFIFGAKDVKLETTDALEQAQRPVWKRFTIALLMGEDQEDIVRNKSTMQSIYNDNYKFLTPPLQPTLISNVSDRKVQLYWDTEAEYSKDPFFGLDFNGYRLYKRR